MISEHASPLAALGGIDSGGQNVYVAQLARHLVALGHKVDVFTRKDNPKTSEVVQLQKDLRVIQVPAGPAEVIPKEQLLPFMDEFTAFMKKYCFQKPYDLIHANFWMSGLVALELKRMLRIPFVITFHALGKIRKIYQKEADGFPECRCAIEREIMQEADRIIAECPQDEKDMIIHYGAEHSRISMVPCGFDRQEFIPISPDQARQELHLPKSEKIFLQLGRLVPRKGIETAIRGFARFYKRTRDKCRLIIVGGNSVHPDPIKTPELGRLKQIAEEENISSQVLFTGQVSRPMLKYYYSAADAFITVPWYEPFGITPLESMACATPVIGSNVGGIKHTVMNGVTGFLIPAQHEEALAERLNVIAENPGRVKVMGENALQRVSLFTWDKVALHMSDIYHMVTNAYASTGGIFG